MLELKRIVPPRFRFLFLDSEIELAISETFSRESNSNFHCSKTAIPVWPRNNYFLKDEIAGGQRGESNLFSWYAPENDAAESWNPLNIKGPNSRLNTRHIQRLYEYK